MLPCPIGTVSALEQFCINRNWLLTFLKGNPPFHISLHKSYHYVPRLNQCRPLCYQHFGCTSLLKTPTCFKTMSKIFRENFPSLCKCSNFLCSPVKVGGIIIWVIRVIISFNSHYSRKSCCVFCFGLRHSLFLHLPQHLNSLRKSSGNTSMHIVSEDKQIRTTKSKTGTCPCHIQTKKRNLCSNLISFSSSPGF